MSLLRIFAELSHEGLPLNLISLVGCADLSIDIVVNDVYYAILFYIRFIDG